METLVEYPFFGSEKACGFGDEDQIKHYLWSFSIFNMAELLRRSFIEDEPFISTVL